MQKINVAAIRKGLFYCFMTGLRVLEERERFLASNGFGRSVDWLGPMVFIMKHAGETACASASDELKRFRY